MTPPKTLYRVRLAREVRQEAEVMVWADSPGDARESAEANVPESARWVSEAPTAARAIGAEEVA